MKNTQQRVEEKPTPEQWARWYNHKSNKERWIEAQERREEDLAESEIIKADLED